MPKILIAATLSPGHPAQADARANDSTRPAALPLPLKNTRGKHTCLVSVCLGSFGAQMPANRHVTDQTGPPARRTRAIDAPVCKGFGGEYGPHRGKRQLKWSRCYIVPRLHGPMPPSPRHYDPSFTYLDIPQTAHGRRTARSYGARNAALDAHTQVTRCADEGNGCGMGVHHSPRRLLAGIVDLWPCQWRNRTRE